MAIEEPKFEVVLTDGTFEIRNYAPYIVAETWVEGDMDEASSKGFRLIADYIFGNNQAVISTPSEKICHDCTGNHRASAKMHDCMGAWKPHKQVACQVHHAQSIHFSDYSKT